MRAPVGGRDGVAVGVDEAVRPGEPRDRPFDRAVLAVLFDPSGKGLVGDQRLAVDVRRQIVLEAAGKAEHGLRRRLLRVGDQRGRAAPADLDPAEQIGFRARHLEHARRIEADARAENLRVGQEAHFCAAPVRRLADDRQGACRLAALKGLAIQRLPARDLDLELLRQRIDDGDADAVQAARRLVGAAVELSARMQHRHDDFERRFFRKLRVRIDRHAAAVVQNAEPPALLERNLDEGRVARDRLVHGIVDHLGEQVVQRIDVRPADIHAGPPPHRLEPLEHLDRRRIVIRLARRAARDRLGLGRNRLAAGGRRRAEEIIHHGGLRGW